MGEKRRRLTCRPLVQLLLFLALFFVHFPPDADAYARHGKLMSRTEKRSDLEKQTLDLRVIEEDLGQPKTAKEQTNRKKRSRKNRSNRDGERHLKEKERLAERQEGATVESTTHTAVVGGSQDDRTSPMTELKSFFQQLWGNVRTARGNATNTSTTESCPLNRLNVVSVNKYSHSRLEHCFVVSLNRTDLIKRIAKFDYCIPIKRNPGTLFDFAMAKVRTVDIGEVMTVFLLDEAMPKFKTAVEYKGIDSKCPFLTFHNASFLDTYDEEFAKYCHDFICKLEMLSEARADHGYVEQYYNHPFPLSTSNKRCMRIARKNGALYHENEYLHMLSFNNSKILTIISVIIYKTLPKVPLHELVFLLLQEEKYEAIKKLFCLVNGIVVGEFGSLYLTNTTFDRLNDTNKNISDSSYLIWMKVIASKPVRIVSIAHNTPSLNTDLSTLLIQGPLRITSNVVHDLFNGLVRGVLFQMQPVFLFEMQQDVLMRHSLVTENQKTLNCTFHSRVTVCRGHSIRSPYTFIFIHNCKPHFFSKAYIAPWYDFFHMLILDTEMEFDLCSNDISFVYNIINFRKSRSRVIDFYLLDHGDIQSVTGSQVIHPFTYLRVYHLASFIDFPNYGIFKILKRKHPYFFFSKYGNTLRKIIAQLEKHYGVDELSLMTESKYKWSVHALLQTAMSLIEADSPECMDEMMRGKYIIYEEDTTRYITNSGGYNGDDICFLLSLDILLQTVDSLHKNKTMINLFWPSCGTLHLRIITNETITSEWQYISTGCRVKQIFLFLFTVLITAVTIGGNSFVLYVIQKFEMWDIRNYGPAFLILRSLAVADLLSGLFPGTLAVWDQLSLITGSLTQRELGKGGNESPVYFPDDQVIKMASLRDLRFERKGYPMFCAFVLSMSSTVSLLMLFLLSVERYMGVRNKVWPCFQVMGSIWSSWIIAILLSILLFIRDDGFYPAGYFDPISKLTISTAKSENSFSIVVFYLVIAFVGIVGVLMICITFYTFYIHMDHRKDREKAGVKVHPDWDIDKEDFTFFIYFFLIIFLYIASILPVTVNIFLGNSEDVPLLQFFAWWFFMAGGSWNWYIYTYRRGPFRKNLGIWKKKRERKRKNRRELKQIEKRQRYVVGRDSVDLNG